MKTYLLKSALLMTSLLGTLSSASAETLHARIPFGFSAGGMAMPAGAYSISTIAGAPHVLLFENEDDEDACHGVRAHGREYAGHTGNTADVHQCR